MPNYLCHTSSDRTIYGLGDFRAYVLALVAAFPDLRMNVDDLYWIGDRRGAYGPPTGRPVNVMGVTHRLIKGGRFTKE